MAERCKQPPFLIRVLWKKPSYACFAELSKALIHCGNHPCELGNVLLKHESETDAFNELGCAFQVAQHQLIRTEKPSWRWAMRLVESTNLLVVVLGRWDYQGLIRDLLNCVQHQVATFPSLSDCPSGRSAKWLCMWCQSMTCPKRQASIERLYVQNEPLIPAGLMH